MAKRLPHPHRNLGAFLHPAKKKPGKVALKNAAKMQEPDRKTKAVTPNATVSLYPK